MPSYKNPSVDMLFKVISNLKTAAECRNFFEDLCTIKELQDMAQRFETAILLSEGQNYQKISESVGISTATISRVNRCLNYGTGGYASAIKSLKDRGDEK